MPGRKNNGVESIFPLSVSAFFIVLILLDYLVSLKLQTRIFLSVFDHISFYALLTGTVIISAFWLLLLVSDSFRLSLRRYYKLVKFLLVFIFYPLAMLISIWNRRSKARLQESFLAFQNRLLLYSIRLDANSRLLLLLPHCLQNHDCRVRITREINDCLDCGKCNISSLKQLAGRYNLKVGIANGGTLARKLVHDNRPDAILAVACHRDLTDGVRDSWRFPVYAILNERPNGPCYDTRVQIEAVEAALESIISSRKS